MVNYVPGQPLAPYQETVMESHHRQLRYNNDHGGWLGPLKIWAPDTNPNSSDNDVVFFQVDPVSGGRCGLTNATLRGEVVLYPWSLELGPYGEFPIGKIEISLCIPWFIWGLP
jgi:hypothetical protein